MSVKVTGSDQRLSLSLPGEGQTWVRQGQQMVAVPFGLITVDAINVHTATLPRGGAVQATSTGGITRAITLARNGFNPNVLGVLAADLPSGESGTVIMSGLAAVLMLAGLSPAPSAGQTVWLSSTGSHATNASSGFGVGARVALGCIVDASTYDVDSTVLVDLRLPGRRRAAPTIVALGIGVNGAGPIALGGAGEVGDVVGGVINVTKGLGFSTSPLVGQYYEGVLSAAATIHQQAAAGDTTGDVILVLLNRTEF
jgi:hypothetical protein